jgi:hypothetical protein
MYRAKQEIVPGSGEGRAIDGGCTAGTILEEDHPIVRQLPGHFELVKKWSWLANRCERGSP